MESSVCSSPVEFKNVTNILVVDDEEAVRRLLTTSLGAAGYDVRTAADGSQALDLVRRDAIDLVLLDIDMPGSDGLETLSRIKQLNSDLPVAMLTGVGTIKTAVDAMKRGAEEFMLKPFSLHTVQALVHQIEARRRSRPAVDSAVFDEEIPADHRLLARDPLMRRTIELIDRIAPLPSTVLIEGESGTGKELVARRIHAHGQQAGHPFVAFNCVVIPEQLLESELFGYEKGAFTGASSRKIGYFEAAAGGTIFIDEISEMSVGLQAKLLRVLQERTFRRIGGIEEIVTDARVVAATNKDLAAEVDAGRFRKDLYYRINVLKISVPPLRCRPQDIPLLCEHFIGRYSRQLGAQVSRIEPVALEELMSRRWDGNVRELQNTMERAVAMARGSEIRLQDLPEARGAAAPEGSTDGSMKPYRAAKLEFESQYFSHALEVTHGNVARASRIAGISRQQLYDKLARYGLEQTEFRHNEGGVA